MQAYCPVTGKAPHAIYLKYNGSRYRSLSNARKILMQSPNVDAAVACHDASDSSGNRVNGCMPETSGYGRKQRDDAIDGEVFRPPSLHPSAYSI